MNTAHYHLLLSHVPVIGMCFGLLINLLALIKNSHDLRIATLLLYAISGIIAVPVYLTGETSEQIVHTIPGITESITEPHEESALLFLIGVSIIGALAVAGLVFAKKSKIFLHRITFILFLLTLANCYFAINTAYTGGKIRHNEIEFNTDTLKLVPDND